MTLADVRDYIESLNVADHVYMGKLPDKKERSVGVYNSKHQHSYRTVLGGTSLEGYGEKYITLLIHWNRSPGDTEKTAVKLFDVLKEARDVTVNNTLIKFIQPLYDVQDIGTDDAGVYEMVIEMMIIYKKEGM